MALKPQTQTRTSGPSGKTRQVQLPKKLASKVRSASGYEGDRGTDIQNTYARFVEELSKTVRKRGDATEIIRTLASDDGMMSTAVYSMVQIASTKFYVVGYDSQTNAPSLDATLMAQWQMSLMDTLSDYTKGFNMKRSIRATVETLVREVALTGACAQELVLDEYQLPNYLQPVAYNTLTKKSNGKNGYYPAQKADGAEPIELNIPNFFLAESNLEADSAYTISLFRAGLRQNFMLQEFLEDTRRGVRKTGHSRLVAKLIAEQVAASAPLDIQRDPKKMAEYMVQAKSSVEDALKDIEPEDAVVSYDSVEFSVEDIGAAKSDYAPLLKLLANIAGSSMKTPSSISGLRADGSQSLSNAETLTYLKIAKSLTGPVEDIMSRTMTLAIRLHGIDGYVKFHMRDIDLRPEAELEAYKSAQQNRILQQLSLGLIDDVYARCRLDLPVVQGMQMLSGTGFLDKSNDAGAPVDRKDAMGKDLNPGTPTKSGGADQ